MARYKMSMPQLSMLRASASYFRTLTFAIGTSVVALMNTAATVAADQASIELDQHAWRSSAQRDSQTRSIPQAQPAPMASNPALEIPIAYLGCWEGAPRADVWHQFSGPPIERWVPSTVTLCFVRQASGVEVTYHKQSLDEAVNQGRIVNARSHTVALGSVGDRIAMRSWGSAQEHGRILGLFDGPTIDIKWMME